MTMWVLFVWLSSATPAASWAYLSHAECERERLPYKRSVCVQVFVPKEKP